MSLFIPLLVAFAFLLTSSTSLDNNNGGLFKATLHHADHHKTLTKTEVLQRSLQRKAKRQATMARLAAAAAGSPSPPATKIAPVNGEDGEFFASFHIGTPPVLQRVRVDTDSDLIWTGQCVNSSLSYSTLVCAHDLCRAESRSTTCNKHGGCVFKYEYAGDTPLQVDLRTETFTFGGNVTVPNLAFACGILDDDQDGGLGLGRGALSLVSQLNAASFAYCLPTIDDADKPGVILFGSTFPVVDKGIITTARLVTNPKKPSPYYVPLEGISVGKVVLPIDVSTFDIDKQNGSGGVVLDTGSTLTYLKRSVFDKVSEEVKKQVKIATFKSSEITELSLCFSVPPEERETFVFPKITLHFEKDNKLELPTWNSYHEYSEGSGNKTMWCLMMTAAPDEDLGMSSVGNILQQNTLVVFDLVKQTVEFRPNTACDKL